MITRYINLNEISLILMVMMCTNAFTNVTSASRWKKLMILVKLNRSRMYYFFLTASKLHKVCVCSQFTRECFLIDSHIITRVIINTPPMSRTQPTKPDLLHIKTSQKSNTHDCQSATYQKQPQSSSPNQLTQNYPSKPTKSIIIRNIKNQKKKETIWFHSLSMTRKV